MSEVTMPNRIALACGATACFDHESGISYRCMNCFAVLGSIGMPQRCKDAEQKYKNWEALGGEGWDYFKGLEDAMD
jgi:hypothetical protein